MHGQDTRLPTFIIASRAVSQAAEAASNADTHNDDDDYEDDSYTDLQHGPIFSQHRVVEDPEVQNLHASLARCVTLKTFSLHMFYLVITSPSGTVTLVCEAVRIGRRMTYRLE